MRATPNYGVVQGSSPRQGAMEGYTVRAVVLHLAEAPGSPAGYGMLVDEAASRLLEAVDYAGVRADSVRLTLPDGDPSVVREAVDEVGEAAESHGVFVSVGGIRASSRMVELVVREAAEAGVFIHVILDAKDWATARIIAEAMNALAESEPVKAARLGVNALGEPVVTPYYPLSSSPGDRELVTAAVTYPNLLAAAYRTGGLRAVEDAAARVGVETLSAVEDVASRLGAEVGGVDLSVAPWMRETSLGLAELVAGTRIPQPGFALGVAEVNRAVRKAAARVKSTGFNELQLPVAEDLKLKLRAAEGVLRASDLARLSGVCLAGLDMAVVPYDRDAVAGLILEVAAYARASGKPLGVRLIPLQDVEPGDKVDLGRFGETPVIRI